MILVAYSIFDRKALQYHPPFFASADGSAVRSLQDLVNDLNTTIGRHPNDFVLFRIGYYDDNKGEIVGLAVLEHVIDAIALVAVAATPLFRETA